jgi:transcriptional accessory protein Tex/SPT6
MAVTGGPVSPAAVAENPPSVAGTPAADAASGEAPPAPPAHAVPPQPVPAVPPAPQPHDLSRIAQDLQIRKAQVESVVLLLDEENTAPFIARYRKERTGGLNEEAVRRIQDRIRQLRLLADRKQTILKSIAYQGRLTDDLTRAVLAAESPKRLEDLYLPFKPKKRSQATEAREKGLEPAALAIWTRDPAVGNVQELFAGLVDPDKWLLNAEDVDKGIKLILADVIADSADVRGPLRNFIWDTGLIAATKAEGLPEGKGKEFEPYANFKEPVKEIPPHRTLAINRGEKEQVLKVKVEVNPATAKEVAAYHLNLADHPHREFLDPVLDDALLRLVLPSLEREVRRELTDRAQEHAIQVFAKNLRSLLLQPPLRGKKVLAIDPGLRTGCKVAVLDEGGKLLDDAVIYPHPPQKKPAEAKRKLEQLVRKHQVAVVAIGNGTGCRETEQLVADLIADLEHRRLNPTPTVDPSAATSPVGGTMTAPAPSVVSEAPPLPAPTAVVSETTAPAPVTLDSAGTFVSDPTPAFGGGNTISFDLPTAPAPVTAETTGAPTPSGETVVTGAGSGPVPLPPPRVPEISLEGLADAPSDLAYVIVIEAGASDYSSGPVAREEFPQLDAATRATISIGRRLQDPLAELVKVDPQHVGVGLYQHDVRPKHLKESLEAVIESSVNQVGVDLNTASVPLLRHVSGMNQVVAREVVTYRDRHGPFKSREALREVPGLGEKRYTQAVGFVKVPDSADPLDATWTHPESYPAARLLLADHAFTPHDLRDRAKVEELREKLRVVNPEEAAARYGAGVPTVRDVLDALAHPGRDPRDDLPPPIFKRGVLRIEDITQGMELKGTVLNVVPFGAFVDIGLKESGLVHISQMANRYIKSPYDVVSVGDVITVWVMEVKPGEKKISLSMIPPGQERRGQGGGRFTDRGPRPERAPGGPPQQQPAGERPAFQPRGERPGFTPRGDRPGFQPRGGQGGGQRRFGGRGPGGPPPRQGAGAPEQAPAEGVAAQAEAAAAPPPKPVRPPRPPKPLPNLTTEKKTGKAALNTFAELAAFFKTKDEPEKLAEEAKPPATEGETPAG